MSKALHLLYTVVSFLLFFSNPLAAQEDPRSAMIKETLEGTSAENSLCAEHWKSEYFSPEDVQLIPPLPGASCLVMDCSKCHSACFLEEEFKDSQGKFPVLFCTCECVQKLRLTGKIPLYQIPSWQPTWSRCPKPAISSNYFLPSPFLSFMQDYLDYVKQNRQCDCYWPEKSTQAASIRKRAYQLFYELMHETVLENLLTDVKLNNDFGFNASKSTKYRVRDSMCSESHKACVHCSFFFSDYVWVCQHLEFYSKKYFSFEEYLPIQLKLDDILEELAPRFRELYKSCLQNHPSEKIKKESNYLDAWEGVLDLFTDESDEIPVLDDVCPVNNDAPSPSTLSLAMANSPQPQRLEKNTLQSKRALASKKAKPPKHAILGQSRATHKSKTIEKRPQTSLESNLLLARGRLLNEYFLYEAAIPVLSKAITLNQNDAFLGQAYDFTLLYDERYAFYKRAMAKADPPPLALLYAFIHCRHAPGIPVVSMSEAMTLMKGALKGYFTPEAIATSPSLFPTEEQEYEYWEDTFISIFNASLSASCIDPPFVREEINEDDFVT